MRGGDTIVALSSGALPAGVAVVRLSGPKAGHLLAELAGGLPQPRVMTLKTLRHDGEVLDRGLVAWFPSPQSFTGEDCAELQVHGSRAVVRALLRAVTTEPGVRLAEAGEFTRRAFEGGRLDLTAVEGLGDLIVAETEAQRRLALVRAGGALASKIGDWRETLLDLRAEIEARLDFSDEGDVNAALPPWVGQRLDDLMRELRAGLGAGEQGRLVREGVRIALAGPPNVGKSSLLNALANSDLAIVSEEAGTTRDVREVALDLGGHLALLVDMAGLRDTESKAEAEGVRRARIELARADLVLWLVAPDQPAAAPPIEAAGVVWTVGTKVDLATAPGAGLLVSARTGAGVAELLAALTAFVEDRAGGEPPLISHERDRDALRRALASLDLVQRDLDRPELAADALRQAGDALGRLIGVIDAEAVLDRLFSAFCIGK
jgi:tRNA modification GTPase